MCNISLPLLTVPLLYLEPDPPLLNNKIYPTRPSEETFGTINLFMVYHHFFVHISWTPSSVHKVPSRSLVTQGTTVYQFILLTLDWWPSSIYLQWSLEPFSSKQPTIPVFGLWHLSKFSLTLYSFITVIYMC